LPPRDTAPPRWFTRSPVGEPFLQAGGVESGSSAGSSRKRGVARAVAFQGSVIPGECHASSIEPMMEPMTGRCHARRGGRWSCWGYAVGRPGTRVGRPGSVIDRARMTSSRPGSRGVRGALVYSVSAGGASLNVKGIQKARALVMGPRRV
jgi:hypothetical protein